MIPSVIRAVFSLFVFAAAVSSRADVLLPSLATNLICRYDFDHPGAASSAQETDRGRSGTDLNLINGGAAMRTNDGAYPGSLFALQTQQLSPATTSNDDWKAGIYNAGGVASLSNFSAVAGITLMGWVKPTGTNPNLNSITASPTDYYNAVGLFGLLSGSSDGHDVRALLEIITITGTNMQLVALGRRVDGSTSLILAATNDWRVLLPSNTWTHLTATFDFDNGTMALYRNGAPLAATTSAANQWNVTTNTDLTSATSPAGIKIGGSYPQNTAEKNAFNGRFDDLMFFDKVLTPAEVSAQFARFAPALAVTRTTDQLTLSWPAPEAGFALEAKTNLSVGSWNSVSNVPASNSGTLFVTQAILATPQFFRLQQP